MHTDEPPSTELTVTPETVPVGPEVVQSPPASLDVKELIVRCFSEAMEKLQHAVDPEEAEKQRAHDLAVEELRQTRAAEEAEKQRKHDAEEAERQRQHTAELAERQRKLDAEEAERQRQHAAEEAERQRKHDAEEAERRRTEAERQRQHEREMLQLQRVGAPAPKKQRTGVTPVPPPPVVHPLDDRQLEKITQALLPAGGHQRLSPWRGPTAGWRR